VGNGILNCGGGGGGGSTGKAGAMGLLQCLSGDSVTMLLVFRGSARRCVRGVIGGSIFSVGGVFEEGISS
jgi:hypothetical protein